MKTAAIAFFFLTFTSLPFAEDKPATQEKRLASITWDTQTGKLTWVVQTGEPAMAAHRECRNCDGRSRRAGSQQRHGYVVLSRLTPEILDVNISPQSHVVGQVPAVVVRVIVDHDLIAVPEPVVAEGEIGVGNAEEESAKPKTPWTASPKAIDVALSNAARKSSMVERPVEMVPGIIPA